YARISPPLRCIRVPAQEDKGESIRRFSCFPSLRVIEIDCSEEAETHLVPELVQAAKETLRICSTFDVRATSESTRDKTAAETARERLASLYSEHRLVRVRYLPGQKPRKNHLHEDPLYYYPSRIEEHVI
ncbi:hypothetical protein FRC06_011420, partial [Ceratobasidium sp. 370]